jgi:preprotein translocase subunit SecA
MLQKFVKTFGGDPNKREIEKTTDIVAQINTLEAEFEALSDEALRAKTDEFRARLAQELDGIEDETERGEVERAMLDEILPEAFATVREAAKRTIGQRPYRRDAHGGRENACRHAAALPERADRPRGPSRDRQRLPGPA